MRRTEIASRMPSLTANDADCIYWYSNWFAVPGLWSNSISTWAPSLLLSLILSVSTTLADVPTMNETTYFPSPGDHFDCLGTDGNRIIAGDSRDDDSGPDAGAVYTYVHQGASWGFESKLVPTRPGPPAPWLTGTYCAMSKDIVVMGSWMRCNTNLGSCPNAPPYISAFVFRNTAGSWNSQELQFSQPSGYPSNFWYISAAAGTNLVGFAVNVQVESDQGDASIAVGTPGTDDPLCTAPEGNTQPGAFFVYDCCGFPVDSNYPWAQETMFSDPADCDTFTNNNPVLELGSSAAFTSDENLLVVGAPGIAYGNVTSGSAWVYSRNRFATPGSQWTLLTELIPSTRDAGAQFGTSVATDGDVIVVGAPRSDLSQLHSGAIFVFRKNGTAWIQEAKILPDAPEQGYDGFGRNVWVQGDRIVEQTQEGENFYVFRYQNGTWNRELHLGTSRTNRRVVGPAGSFFGTTFVTWSRNNSGPADKQVSVFELSQFTAPGSNVVVIPENLGDRSAPVTLTFDQVTQQGATTVTTSTQGTPPPSGFQLGDPPTYFQISTTAQFSGSVQVCFDYSNISFTNEDSLKLLHEDGSGWSDITTSLDTTNNIICGVTTSFSAFAIVQSSIQIPAVSATGMAILGIGVLTAGIVVYLKRQSMVR